MKDLKKALEYHTKALKIDPEEGRLWGAVGKALAALERYEEAIKCYDKALEIDPVHIDAWIGKGCSLYVLDKDKEAKKCFENVIKFSNGGDEIAKEKAEFARKWLKDLM